MDELFWSSLPGIPKKMKWPVKVVKWLPKPLVYCKCDDAYFNVSRDQLVPFSDDVNVIETFKNKGIELVFGSETNMCTDTIELQTEIGDGTAPLNGVSDDKMQPDIQTVDTYDEYEFQDEDSPEEETKRKSKSQNTRVAWTPTEINEIQEYFETNINSGVTPGRKECLKAIEQSRKKKGSIHRRQWETIKKKVWNLIQKNKL